MRYVMVSTAVVDEIHFPNSELVIQAAGGAGLYAYAGARLWHHDIALVCGKGKDFSQTLGPIFAEHGIGDEYMFPVDLETPRTIVRYQDDGERTETPVYGKSHYERFVAGFEQLSAHLDHVRGVYLFKAADDQIFWDLLLARKKASPFTLMWEISASSTKPEYLETIVNLAKQVDILSINRTEAANLFGGTENEVVEQLKALCIPLVFYRRGKQGAMLITADQEVGVPSDFTYKLVDPTGAGNSSSAAVLVGYCEKKDLYEIGMMGSIASGSNIEQYGIAPLSDKKVYERASQRLAYWLEERR